MLIDAVGCLPNHINANLAQSNKHTVQHYDQETVDFHFFLFSIHDSLKVNLTF